MTILSAPPGIDRIQIHGLTFTADPAGRFDVRDEEVERIMKRHGFIDEVTRARRAAKAAADAPGAVAAPSAAPAYSTGPYRHALRYLREEGIEIADDAADSAVLMKLNDVLGELFAEKAPDSPAAADADECPDLETAKQPEIVGWLKRRGVAIAGNAARVIAVQAAQDYLEANRA